MKSFYPILCFCFLAYGPLLAQNTDTTKVRTHPSFILGGQLDFRFISHQYTNPEYIKSEYNISFFPHLAWPTKKNDYVGIRFGLSSGYNAPFSVPAVKAKVDFNGFYRQKFSINPDIGINLEWGFGLSFSAYEDQFIDYYETPSAISNFLYCSPGFYYVLSEKCQINMMGMVRGDFYYKDGGIPKQYDIVSELDLDNISLGVDFFF